MRYVWILLVPWHLSADYSYPEIVPISMGSAQAMAALAMLVGGAVAAVWMVRRRSPWLVGPLVFMAALLPTSNILFRIGTVMGERLLYLPSVGFALVVGLIGLRVWHIRGGRVALALVVLALGVRTAVRNRDWRNDHALFSSAVRTCPRSARARLNLGLAAWQANQAPQAESAIREAIRLYPDYVRARAKLAALLLDRGRTEEARLWAVSALERDPDFPDALLTAGNVATVQGDLERAESCFRGLLRVRPASQAAAFNLANTLRARHQGKEAVAGYRDLVARAPDHAGAWTNLVDTLLGLGLDPEALEEARRGGVAFDRVVKSASAGCAMDPAWGAFATVSGVVHLRHGRIEEARSLLERAIALRPDLMQAHRWLAEAVKDTDPGMARKAYHLGATQDREKSEAGGHR